MVVALHAIFIYQESNIKWAVDAACSQQQHNGTVNFE